MIDHTDELAVIADVADAVDPALPRPHRDAARRRAIGEHPQVAAEYAIAMLAAVLASLNNWFGEPAAAEHVMRIVRERGGRVEFDDEVPA